MSGIQNTSLSWAFPYTICYETFLNTWERHHHSGPKARNLGSMMPHLSCSGCSVESIPPLKRWFGELSYPTRWNMYILLLENGIFLWRSIPGQKWSSPWNAVLLLRTRNRKYGLHIPPRTQRGRESQKEYRHCFLSWTPSLQSDASTGIGEAASSFVFIPTASLQEELVFPGTGFQFSFTRKNVKLSQRLEELPEG